jgi:hypothetical protein
MRVIKGRVRVLSQRRAAESNDLFALGAKEGTAQFLYSSIHRGRAYFHTEKSHGRSWCQSQDSAWSLTFLADVESADLDRQLCCAVVIPNRYAPASDEDYTDDVLLEHKQGFINAFS